MSSPGIDPRTVWERLGRGETVDGICADLPAQDGEAVRAVADDLLTRLDSDLAEVNRQFTAVLQRSRPQFASWVAHSPHRTVLLALFDGRDPVPLIWEALRPDGGGQPGDEG